MRQFLLLCFIPLFCLVFSCKKDKLKSPAASFLVVNATSVTSGTLSLAETHKITDIWLYVNDQFQGIYPIGSVMPVLSSGTANIKMYGGIMNNGISATRLPYSFYDAYSLTGNFEAQKTYTIVPVFKYRSGISVQSEAFNSGGSTYKSVGDSSVTTIADPSLVWGGTGYSLFMSMNDAKPTSKIVSSTTVTLPAGGKEVYLELDYKCNQEITVGVICGGGIEERTALTLRATNGWNKVYISLTSAASTQPTYNYYEIFISAVKQSDVPSPQIYLDNIRLVRP